MKKILLYFLATMITIGCGYKQTAEEEIKARKKQAFRDSVYSKIPEFYNLEKDSFRPGDYVSVFPLNKPKNRNQDALWAYFIMENKKATMFKLVIQSSANNSIIGTVMFIFNVDGKICEITPQPYMANESFDGSYYVIPSAYASELLDSIDANSVVKMKTTNLQTYTVRDIPVSSKHQTLKERINSNQYHL